MLREEFENLVDNVISPEVFEKINTVYVWHPSISDTKGKDQVAYLYINFEMQVIEDMLPRAQKIMELEQKISNCKTRIRELEIEKNKIANL